MLRDLTTEQLVEMISVMNDVNKGEDSFEETDLSWGEAQGLSTNELMRLDDDERW